MDSRFAFTRRQFLGGSLIGSTVLLAPGLAGCSSDDSDTRSGEPKPISVQLSWLKTVSFAGTYIADDRGYFEAEGLGVRLKPGGPSVVVPPLVSTGQSLIGMASTDVVASTNAAGGDLVIVGARFQKSPFAIVSLPERPINVPADLIGLRVGVSPTNDLAFKSFLATNEIDVKDVDQLPIQFDTGPLTNGEVDAILGYITAQPNVLRASGVQPVTMLLADYGFNLFENVYIARRVDLQDERESIIGFMRGEQRGWRDALDEPDVAIDLTLEKYAEDTGLDRASQKLEANAQASLIESNETDTNGLFWMSESAIAQNLSTLASLGLQSDPVLFDTSVLEEIRETTS